MNEIKEGFRGSPGEKKDKQPQRLRHSLGQIKIGKRYVPRRHRSNGWSPTIRKHRTSHPHPRDGGERRRSTIAGHHAIPTPLLVATSRNPNPNSDRGAELDDLLGFMPSSQSSSSHREIGSPEDPF